MKQSVVNVLLAAVALLMLCGACSATVWMVTWLADVALPAVRTWLNGAPTAVDVLLLGALALVFVALAEREVGR